MISSQTHTYVSEILEAESGRLPDGEKPAAVVRWALVAEVLEPGDEDVSLDVIASDNLTSWQARGLAWALERQAEDLHLMD